MNVWKTIKLGTGVKSGRAFYTILRKNAFSVSDRARNLLKHLRRKALTLASKQTEIDLVIMGVMDLGFEEVARYDQICARAFEMGFNLCPAEVGPQLRLQYFNQPRGERLVVAMEAIQPSDGPLAVFTVLHDDDTRYLWLETVPNPPDQVWSTNTKFVFQRRRTSGK